MALVLDTDPCLVNVAFVPSGSGSGAIIDLNCEVLLKCLDDVVAAVNQQRQSAAVTDERVESIDQRLEHLSQSTLGVLGHLRGDESASPTGLPVTDTSPESPMAPQLFIAPTTESNIDEGEAHPDNHIESVSSADSPSSAGKLRIGGMFQQVLGVSSAVRKFQKSGTQSLSDVTSVKALTQKVTDAEELSKKQQADWREMKQSQRTIKESLEAARRQLGGVDVVALETHLQSLLKRQDADEEENEEQARNIATNTAKVQEHDKILEQLQRDVHELLLASQEPEEVAEPEPPKYASDEALEELRAQIQDLVAVVEQLKYDHQCLKQSQQETPNYASDEALEELRAQIRDLVAVAELLKCDYQSQQKLIQAIESSMSGHTNVIHSHDGAIKQLQLDASNFMERFKDLDNNFKDLDNEMKSQFAKQSEQLANLKSAADLTDSIAEARARDMQRLLEEMFAAEKLKAQSDAESLIMAQCNELQQRLDNQLNILREWLQDAFVKHEAIVRSKADRTEVDFGNEALRKVHQKLHTLDKGFERSHRNVGTLADELERVRQLLDKVSHLLEVSPGNSHATPGPEQGDALLGVQPLRRCLSCQQVVRGTSPLDSVNLRLEAAKEEIFKEIQQAVLRSNKEGREAVMQFRCVRVPNQEATVEDLKPIEDLKSSTAPQPQPSLKPKADSTSVTKGLGLQGQGWGDAGASLTSQSLPARRVRPSSAPNGRPHSASRAAGQRGGRVFTVMDMMKKS